MGKMTTTADDARRLDDSIEKMREMFDSVVGGMRALRHRIDTDAAVARREAHACDAVIPAAAALLARLEHITTAEFSVAGEREERLALKRAVLMAQGLPLTEDAYPDPGPSETRKSVYALARATRNLLLIVPDDHVLTSAHALKALREIEAVFGDPEGDGGAGKAVAQ